MTRFSEAALALVSRKNVTAHTEYLAQWNHNWNAYSLIGGHVEDGETFRQACLREICEELECDAAGIQLAPYPYATLRFREYSRAAKQDTDYHWQVFVTRLPDTVLSNLPTDCQWITADQIRSGSAADGKPIADQAKRVLKAVDEAEFDLFVSYGHADNTDDSVTALVEHIRREHERFAPTEPLKVFFDLWGIQNSDDWERRIYRGLIESKTMLAVLSPAYFASEWCQKEYETFHQQQLKKLYPGEPVHAIYIQQHPDFEASETGDAHPLQDWFDGLKKQQFEDAKPWWPDGQTALQQDVVVGRLNELRQNIWKHVCDTRAIQQSPSNISGFNVNFVGREQELTELWNTLRLDQAVAVSAIQGVGGLGKTALARAYAHTRRMDYLGGQFEIGMENVSTMDGLKLEIVRLANLYLGANIPDETTNTNLNAAFAMAKACFERPGQGNILLILDNVAEEGVLSARTTCLPSPEFVHVLATTRLDPERWGLNSLKLESLSTKDALDLFQKYRPFQIPDDTERWNRILNNSESIPETEVDTDEWKAAVGIVNRLGGHALAIEVVAVYLGNHRSISLVDYLQGLISKGLNVKLSQAGDDPSVKARLSAAIETNIGELLKPTFERLEQENPLAMRALEWAALMPPDHVPWPWLRDLIELDHSDALQHDPDDPDPWTDIVIGHLIGWRLLTSNDNQLTARIHRIVQTAIALRTSPRTADELGATTDRFLSYLYFCSDLLTENWGRGGVKWELVPLLEATQLLLPSLGFRTASIIDRLIMPLQLDGRLLTGLNLQQALIALLEDLRTQQPQNNEYASYLAASYARRSDLFKTCGNMTEAHEFCEKAIEISLRLSARVPNNPEYTRMLAGHYGRMGHLLRASGNGGTALELYTKSLELQERLFASSPANADYASDLSDSYNSIAAQYSSTGDTISALELYEKALEVRELLAAHHPGNDLYANDLANTYNKMGDLHRGMGNSTEARGYYAKALKVCEQLAASRPENAEYEHSRSMSYLRMGDTSLELRELSQARGWYEKCAAIYKQLTATSSENVEYARALALAYSKLGNLHCTLGNMAQARDFYVKALEQRERLVAYAPESVYYQSDLSQSYLELSNLSSALHNRTQARKFLEKGLEVLERLNAVAPENDYYTKRLLSCYREIAWYAAESGVPEADRNWALKAHDILQGMVDRGLHVSPDDLGFLKQLKQRLEES